MYEVYKRTKGRKRKACKKLFCSKGRWVTLNGPNPFSFLLLDLLLPPLLLWLANCLRSDHEHINWYQSIDLGMADAKGISKLDEAVQKLRETTERQQHLLTELVC